MDKIPEGPGGSRRFGPGGAGPGWVPAPPPASAGRPPRTPPTRAHPDSAAGETEPLLGWPPIPVVHPHPPNRGPSAADPAPPEFTGGDGAESRSRRAGVALILGRSAAALLSIAVFAVCAFASVTAANASRKVATGASTAAAGAAGVLFRGGSNILLIGSDARTDQQGNPLSAAELAAVSTQADGGGVNTDTIMVVHIPQGGGQASGISLPRDTWIPPAVTNMVKGPYDDGTQGPYKPNKINSFYGTAKFYTQARDRRKGGMTAAQAEVDSNNAGRTELQAIVQAFTGLRIDHYAEINLIGFYTLSNAIGGVPVCLNSAVNDPYSGAHFKAGPQQISGSAAMSFVRQRHGLPQGDLDRVRRQQAFLAGATSKMLSAGTLTSPSRLSSLTDAASRSLVLDSGFDLLSFASQMADLSGGKVSFRTLPTHGVDASSGTGALATDPAELKTFFAAIDGAAPIPTSRPAAPPTTATAAIDPSTITVDVQNATKINKLAASVSATLKSAGFTAGQVSTMVGITTTNQHRTTTISYPSNSQAAAAAVQKALGGKGALHKDNSIPSGHILIAAGADMPTPSALRRPEQLDIPREAAAPAASPTPITAATVGCIN